VTRHRRDASPGGSQEFPPTAWLRWGRELQALAQTGLAFGKTDYDLERYRRVAAIAAEIVAAGAAGAEGAGTAGVGDPHASPAAEPLGPGRSLAPGASAADASTGILDRFLAHLGYATPKIDVRAAIVRDGRILLVQERTDERWAMPGGWADVGEPPSAMVAREVVEESGLVVVPRKLLAVFDANREGHRLELFHAYKMVFLCEEAGGTLGPGDETLAADFFAFDALPPLSTARTNDRYLAEVRAQLADPRRPTFFD
jgi:ADP-ribose pyrophosphatase YjhB (NUDIX family)